MADIRLRLDGLLLTAIDVSTENTINSWDAISGWPGQQAAYLQNTLSFGPSLARVKSARIQAQSID